MTLFEFEEKYKFLYEELVCGVSIYTCLRDNVSAILVGSLKTNQAVEQNAKGKIYPKRLIDTLLKWRKYRNCKTVIFTSAVYRRDHGRNLNVEFLMKKYPDAVAFEWPSRNEMFDRAYFDDKADYVPLDAYILLYKLYCFLHKKQMANLEEECRIRLKKNFDRFTTESETEKYAIEYLLNTLPNSVVSTQFSQQIFKWLFRNYNNIEYAVDFWGSGRENIIPVLQGKPKSIELQHGIITPIHPGYIYPAFVKNIKSSLFERYILVFSEKEKKFLTQNSIYQIDQIEVVGNPRIQMYKNSDKVNKKKKKWVLFTSQPYEQDYHGYSYYTEMIPYLKHIKKFIDRDGRFQLAIKLHPRENDSIKKRYEEEIPGVMVFGSSAQLYEIFSETYLHITATSTTLFEALEFDVPTVTVQFMDYNPITIFGIKTLHLRCVEDIDTILRCMYDKSYYNKYLLQLNSVTN